MHHRLSRRAAVVALAAWRPSPPGAGRDAAAQAVTPIKFVLDWKLQGIHAWYYLAEDKGYFAQEKLAVTIDQGDGSAAAVTKVMAGAYQAGFGDVNAIVQNAVGQARPGAGDGLHDLQPRAVRADRRRPASPIKTLKDLEGRTLGTAGRRRGRAHVPGDGGARPASTRPR